MQINSQCRPRLPGHYHILFEPPDEKGDEVLHFISDSRRIKLKGYAFREFQQYLVPLLNGRQTLEEIQAEVADLFAPEDVETCLNLLIEHNLLEDASQFSLSPEMQERLAPQLNFFQEVTAASHETQRRLSRSAVAVFGLSGAGAATAVSLAIAGVGTIIGIDAGKISAADSYLSTVYTPQDTGAERAEILRRRLAEIAPETKFIAQTETLNTDEDVRQTIQAANFTVCALDSGQSSLVYKLNRVCFATKANWLLCEAAGAEVSVGPLIVPDETACFLCYKMRLVACSENPEDEFAFQRYLDQRKQDDSPTRENLIFGTNLAGQLAALETTKFLTQAVAPAIRGRTVVVDLLDLTMTKHLVLRKPWCPACQPQFQTPTGGIDERTAASVAD